MAGQNPMPQMPKIPQNVTNPGSTPPPGHPGSPGNWPTIPSAPPGVPGGGYNAWGPSPKAPGATPPAPKLVFGRFPRVPVFIAAIVISTLLVLGPLGIATALVLNHVFAKPDGYLLTSDTTVAFIQFTEDQNGHLTGSLEQVYATADNTVQNESAAFTGVRNGSQFSLTFSALGLSQTDTGTLNGNTLTLQWPDQNGLVETGVFRAASTSDYNTAAQNLRHRIAGYAAASQAAQATASTQQANAQATATGQQALDQAVTTANNQLSGDLTGLTSDIQSLASSTKFGDALNGYAKDWSQMQADYQQEQNDYKNGCGDGGYNASVVAYDASNVSYDLSSIQYDDSSLNYDKSSMSTALQQVQSDMQAVQSDWGTLQSAVAADTTGGVSSEFSQSDVNAAVAKAQQQIDASNKALASAQGKANQYDQEAVQMNTNAQSLANSMHC